MILCDCRGVVLRANCEQHRRAGFTHGGLYGIQLVVGQNSFKVLCDMTVDGGGWAMFQRRFDGKISFGNRTWEEHVSGFCDLHQEFWLGLKKLNLLTKTRSKNYASI